MSTDEADQFGSPSFIVHLFTNIKLSVTLLFISNYFCNCVVIFLTSFIILTILLYISSVYKFYISNARLNKRIHFFLLVYFFEGNFQLCYEFTKWTVFYHTMLYTCKPTYDIKDLKKENAFKTIDLIIDEKINT